ncbi:MAG: 30S ribosomal protein S20 [Candidatus Omnitrophica bacterium]|nr:30S ribosomal protein S20 [Candidatus Omnitrophota bacterium]
MPQRKSAQKALRADKKRREFNLVLKRKIKQAIKKYLKAINAKDLDQAKQSLQIVYKQLDKAAFKKYIHKNNAARKKSRLSKKLKVLKSS